MLYVDYLSRFLDHPTWPSAIVISVVAIAIAWIIVTICKMLLN